MEDPRGCFRGIFISKCFRELKNRRVLRFDGRLGPKEWTGVFQGHRMGSGSDENVGTNGNDLRGKGREGRKGEKEDPVSEFIRDPLMRRRSLDMGAFLCRALLQRGIGPEFCIFYQAIGSILKRKSILYIPGDGIIHPFGEGSSAPFERKAYQREAQTRNRKKQQDLFHGFDSERNGYSLFSCKNTAHRGAQGEPGFLGSEDREKQGKTLETVRLRIKDGISQNAGVRSGIFSSK